MSDQPDEARELVHDLNNLLGAIMNYAQLVAKEVNRAAAGELDRPWATVAEDVAQIEQAVARAADVSQRLREVGR
jgi:signal transduction histidine kinase